jgi:hypothetical protein
MTEVEGKINNQPIGGNIPFVDKKPCKTLVGAVFYMRKKENQ